MIQQSQILRHTNILSLLSDPSRYKILYLILHATYDMCVNEIAGLVEISPSAVSHQLSKLELAGIVYPKRKGQKVCYLFTDSAEAKLIIGVIETFTDSINHDGHK